MIKIAPSILAADPLNLEKDIKRVEKAGCDWIHVDIMDAHFVPNLAYSADVVRRLKESTSLPLDVHLMMDNPETMIDTFLDAGASCLTIHAEIQKDIPALLDRIRLKGRMAGIALKPGSPLEMITGYLDQTDHASRGAGSIPARLSSAAHRGRAALKSSRKCTSRSRGGILPCCRA